MTTDVKPIKCVSRDYGQNPFYVIQTNGESQRVVAFFQKKEKIRHFLLEFIEGSGPGLQIKIRDLDDREIPIEFDGQVAKSVLKSILNKYDEVIFHDGFHELMLRRPESGDFVAFDEHGLVFIYSADNYTDTLESLGLTHRQDEDLIYQYDHWHFRPANGRQGLKDLITELGLV